MPHFDIVKDHRPEDTFRVNSVRSAFDIQDEAISEQFIGSLDIEDSPWSIGLIVGASGTGKSTIARQVFGDSYVWGYDYSASSVVDDMPEGVEVKEITKAFTSVGFASPPSWLKPYSVLSNGERMRCDLARAILEQRQLIVFDEFTSVVDRDVARTGSLAIQKAVRRAGKQFVAVSCHRDIQDWLMPDWLYSTDDHRFFFAKSTPDQQSVSTSIAGEAIESRHGEYSASITI